MLPVVPEVVMPAVDPIMRPAPEDSVKLPAPPSVLVPIASEAPLLTVKLMAFEIVPPDVTVWTPAFWKTTDAVPVPTKVNVPAVGEKSPLILSVDVALLASPIEKVPPVIEKLALTLMVAVELFELDNARYPPDWV